MSVTMDGMVNWGERSLEVNSHLRQTDPRENGSLGANGH